MTTAEQTVYSPPSSAHLPAVGTRRPVPALVAAAGAAGGFFVLVLVQVLATGLYNEANSQFEDGFGSLFAVAAESMGQTVPVVIVVLVVAFVFFWGIAPIRAGLRISQAIGRGVWCAIGIGAVLAATFFVQFLVISGAAGSQYGGPSKHDLLRNAEASSLQAIDFFLQTIAIVVLAGLLLWHWSRRRSESAPV